MSQRVLILTWAGSAYDSLRGLLGLLESAYAAQGISVLALPTDEPGWVAALPALLRRGDIAFAVTLSGVGVDASVDGASVWDTANVPLFNWSCDHPCYYPSRHAARGRNILHGYVFPDHARYSLTQIRSTGMTFAAHLGIPPRDIFPAAALPERPRNGRILFAKSGRDPTQIQANWRRLSPDLATILFGAAEELRHGSTEDILPVLVRIAEPYGLFIDGASRLAMALIEELDGFLRAQRADLVMRVARGYPVDVVGSGWDYVNWTGARARHHGAVTWASMVRSLPSYLGCLSINPLVQDSVHDRVFFALAAGTPPISDSNRFSRTHMGELEGYAFGFTEARIRSAIEAVLEDPATALARTEAAWARLSGPFGLRRAALQIAQFAAMRDLNAPIAP